MKRIILTLFVSLLFLSSCVGYNAVKDYQFSNVNSLNPINSIETAYPQTAVHYWVLEHFNAPLTASKTVKKALVMGLDGTRPDCLSLAGIQDYIDPLDSFHFYFSFAGGEKKMGTLQETRTAPGWTTILTGVWSNQHGVTNNAVPPKNPQYLSFIEKLANLDYKVGITAAWEAITENATSLAPNVSRFTPDGRYYKNMGEYYTKDERVFNQIKEWIDKDYDCIFSVFDFTDHIGHAEGFSPESEPYVEGINKALQMVSELIKKTQQRPNYENEEWLYLITTDHGGLKKTHGAQSLPEKTTFIYANQIAPKNLPLH